MIRTILYNFKKMKPSFNIQANTTTDKCSSPKEPEPTALFIGGLNPLSTEQSIRTYFERFGPLEEVNLIIDWVTGESKCCSIVIFERGTSGKQALRKKKHSIDNTRVRVSIADDKKKGTKIVKTKKLYIGNLPPRTSENDLIEYFGRFGNLIATTIAPRKLDHEQTLHGFVEFEDMITATKVLELRHDLIIHGEKITCSPYRAKEVLEKSMKRSEDVEQMLIQEMAKMITKQIDLSNMHTILYGI